MRRLGPFCSDDQGSTQHARPPLHARICGNKLQRWSTSILLHLSSPLSGCLCRYSSQACYQLTVKLRHGSKAELCGMMRENQRCTTQSRSSHDLLLGGWRARGPAPRRCYLPALRSDELNPASSGMYVSIEFLRSRILVSPGPNRSLCFCRNCSFTSSGQSGHSKRSWPSFPQYRHVADAMLMLALRCRPLPRCCVGLVGLLLPLLAVLAPQPMPASLGGRRQDCRSGRRRSWQKMLF